jgi:hypothetical protein
VARPAPGLAFTPQSSDGSLSPRLAAPKLVVARGDPPVRGATFPLPVIAARRLIEVHELEPSVIHLPPVFGT